MFSPIPKISPQNVEKRIQDDPFQVIDVRSREEVRHGKIPQAVNIPLDELEERMEELDTSEQYVMVCRSGNRSAKAAKRLQKNGYDVKNMTGGMMKWRGDIEV
ncbi:rhodanese-like domain-containing protein [Salibacterium halotolerans]|uniref:Rhodanese-related sulfurtransferase n=1 Tax=Salibacterium halotolerans TaxID=1884432 RepID=A0A1I5U830_9BACI|nr:rhodanese-like domain-containing protein [Salibacterium halotolerans]SFP91087.1 Rhodanese-related sulfurtransferase [Salibacterium halotolerans]